MTTPSLLDAIAPLTARDVMRRDVLLVEGGTSIADTWQAMHEAGVEHALVLVDGTFLGIIGLSELWVAWSLELVPAAQRSVLPLAVPGPSVATDTTLPQLCQVLLRSRFGAATVLDDDGQLQGLVTTRDLLDRLAGSAQP